jgi:ubiquitin-conjugating enzyme E2 G1
MMKCLANWWKLAERDSSQFYSAGLIDGSLRSWRVTIIGAAESPYEGGLFPTRLDFPDDFPLAPPTLKFLCPMWHPNIRASDGDVCISILHRPGIDPMNPDEPASERWLPVHSLESIVVSVLALLHEPNLSSPVNVKAARQLREDEAGYWRRVRQEAERSVEYCG